MPIWTDNRGGIAGIDSKKSAPHICMTLHVCPWICPFFPSSHGIVGDINISILSPAGMIPCSPPLCLLR